ncbi:MAG: hypothetical protein F9K29_06320 [Hyphomicrobiaceae bacterium]|nr:MAG: hypothetical protein F9K29_06320 [Hyphomicrobiaceae bacterium]
MQTVSGAAMHVDVIGVAPNDVATGAHRTTGVGASPERPDLGNVREMHKKPVGRSEPKQPRGDESR